MVKVTKVLLTRLKELFTEAKKEGVEFHRYGEWIEEKVKDVKYDRDEDYSKFEGSKISKVNVDDDSQYAVTIYRTPLASNHSIMMSPAFGTPISRDVLDVLRNPLALKKLATQKQPGKFSRIDKALAKSPRNFSRPNMFGVDKKLTLEI